MMARIADLAADHPHISIIVSFVILVVIASNIVRFDAAHDGPIAHLMHAEQRDDTRETAEAAALSEEPKRLQALREANTQVTDEALQLLVANAWEDDAGTVVEFTPACIRTRGQGFDTFEPYAVCTSERRQEFRDGMGSTVWDLCVETASWSALLHLTAPNPVHDQAEGQGEDQAQAQDRSPSQEQPQDEGQGQTQDQSQGQNQGQNQGQGQGQNQTQDPDAAPTRRPTLSCRDIASGSTLTASAERKPLTIEGPDEATLAAHGTTPRDVGRALSAWCVDWTPTAMYATWDKTILEDHEGRAWEIRYTLDDRYGTKVSVAVGMDTHEIEVREGRS